MADDPTRDVLIAEDLLLLLLHDEKGSVQHAYHLDPVLGGALLVELALGGHVEPVPQEKRWGWTPKDRVRATPEVPADPLLREAQDLVAEKERTAQDLVTRLGRKRRDPLLERLADRGFVRREQGKVLGLFPRTTWPEADGRHEEALRARLEAVLLRDDVPDDRTGALVALLSGADVAQKVVRSDRRRSRDVARRAKVVAEGDWAAAGVKDAIAAANAATMAAITASTAAASSGSS
ncbi:GOLPH3/VPS74 family protein [Nocardioides marmoraquaticus]